MFPGNLLFNQFLPMCQLGKTSDPGIRSRYPIRKRGLEVWNTEALLEDLLEEVPSVLQNPTVAAASDI